MVDTLLVGPKPPPYGGWAHVYASLARPPFTDVVALDEFSTQLGRGAGRFRSAVKAFDQLRSFRRKLEGSRPDMVLLLTGPGMSFWRDMAMVGECHRQGVPVIVRMFGGILPFRLARLPTVPRRYVTSLLRRCRALAIETREGQEALRELVPETAVWRVPNFVHLEELPSRSRGRDEGEPVRALFFGNMTPTKGVERILSVVDTVLERAPVEFHFVGGEIEPGYLDRFRAEVDRLRHPDSVKVHGQLPRNDLLTLAAKCQLFPYPSLWPGEGQPASLIEAMALGLVPVAARWRGVAEIVTDGVNGRLLEADDREGLAQALTGLAQDAEARDRLADNAVSTIVNEYSAGPGSRVYREMIEAAVRES